MFKYDSNQLAQEIASLKSNKETFSQQYHKTCGAIEMLEAMQKRALESEKEDMSENAASPDVIIYDTP